MVEYEKEDMYGYGTRRFSGPLPTPGDNESGAGMFEYWINIRTYLAVRLIISLVDRNVEFDSRGNPISKETYINIRYYDWQ